MLNIIQNQILFFLAVGFLMFLPGFCLLLAVFRKSAALSTLERFIISFGLSIIVVDFILFTYSKLNIGITRISIILGVLFFSAVCFSIYKFLGHGVSNWTLRVQNEPEDKLFSFSKNQFILILLLLFLTIFIKTAYLSTAIAPTATDFGHHLYWAKTIAETHQLTSYEGMPDFIIGEHTMFASINILTGLNFLTGWPVVVLFLINLLGILTVFILTLRIFKNKLIAILTLLFLGVLFAVASPQAKYVSGGVMGNIFGNFLMPLAFYFYYRTFEFLNSKNQYPPLLLGEDVASSRQERALIKNSKTFLSLAVFTTFGLFYTHHLTSFIFLFIFLLLIPLFLIVNYKDVEVVLKKSAKIIFSPQVLGIFVLGLIFFFFVFTPTYVNTKAVDTAVGAATKSTRVGLTITNIKQTVGEPRLALGFLGFLLLILTFRRKNFGYALLASWTFMLFIMSSFPNLLFVDLPSSRIGNYLSYPLAILSAFAFYTVFRPESYETLWGKKLCEKPYVMDKLLKSAFLILLAFVLVTGLNDSAQAFKKQAELTQLNQTFDVSKYLADNTNANDQILKDHNYITADSWMKLFFMRGYKYPQSRGFFSRYEAQGSRSGEICTLVMISSPGSDEAKQCFSDTKTDFLVINPMYDAPQFQKLPEFNQVYMSNDIAVYYRK
ncbi:MAG: DUF1616 domain-containing protein [Parcubacteria group bacterium]|jgi:hypothetical protein